MEPDKKDIKECDKLKSLTKKELLQIQAGEISMSLMIGIGGLGVFFIGILDGLLHPKSCKVTSNE